jgi:opacity protein-like surface antigen
LAIIVALTFILTNVGAASASVDIVYMSFKGGYSSQKVDRELKVKNTLDFGDLVLGNNDFNLGGGTNKTFFGSYAFGLDFYNWFVVPVRWELEYSYHVRETVTTAKVFDANLVVDGTPVKGSINFEEKANMGIHTIMSNLYYDFRVISEKITPYVGVGFGLGLFYVSMDSGTNIQYAGKTHTDTFDYGAANVVWSVAAGVAIAVTDNVSVDIGYKYVDGGLTSLNNGLGDDFDFDGDFKIHDLFAGIRYSW